MSSWPKSEKTLTKIAILQYFDSPNQNQMRKKSSPSKCNFEKKEVVLALPIALFTHLVSPLLGVPLLSIECKIYHEIYIISLIVVVILFSSMFHPAIIRTLHYGLSSVEKW